MFLREQEKRTGEREEIEKQKKMLAKKRPPSAAAIAKNSKHEYFVKPGEK